MNDMKTAEAGLDLKEAIAKTRTEPPHCLSLPTSSKSMRPSNTIRTGREGSYAFPGSSGSSSEAVGAKKFSRQDLLSVENLLATVGTRRRWRTLSLAWVSIAGSCRFSRKHQVCQRSSL